jgi:transcriptional regulator with XRE-family HTH domain
MVFHFGKCVNTKMHFGENSFGVGMSAWKHIEPLMRKNGISSKKLAYIAGVVPSSVTKWKNGSSIRNEALNRIAVHFGVSVDWLLRESETSASIDASPTAIHCRYPEACDIQAEFGQVREELASVEASLASMTAQLDTVTRLLGAALGNGLSHPKEQRHRAAG